MKRKLALLLITTLTAAAIPFSAPAYAADTPSEETVTEAGEAGLPAPESTTPTSAEEETVTSGPVQEAEDSPVKAEETDVPAQTEDIDVPAPAEDTPAGEEDAGSSDEVLSPEDIPMEAPDPEPGLIEETSDEETVPDESSEEIEDLEAAELEDAEAGNLPKITAAGWYYFNGGWHLYFVDPKDKVLKQHVSEWVDFPAEQTVSGPDISVVLSDASTTDPGTVTTQTQTLVVKKGKHFFDKDGNFAIAGPFETPDAGIQYFDKDGFIQTGWVIYDGVWHYFDEKSGILKYAWKYLKEEIKVRSQETGKKVTIKSGRHFFDENGDQVTDNVIMTPDKGLQFFNSDGVRKVGYQRCNGYWYYFEKETGAIIDGWKYVKTDKAAVNYKTGGTYTFKAGWHFFDSQGRHFKKGLYNTPDKGTQYFNAYGVRKVGYVKIDGKWYHFKKETGMDKGIVWLSAKTVSGTRFGKGSHYFNTSTGVHVTNAWVDFEGNRYRLGSDGTALTGWQKLDGAYYHFNTKGIMEKNKSVSGISLGANGKASVSNAQAEMMIRVQSISSNTNWLCVTDKDNHRAGFFKGYKGNWTLVKYWPVAVGAWYQGKSRTPSGNYRVAYHQYRMTHLTSFYYVTWTSAGVGYHSKLYSINVYSPNNPIVDNSMAVHITNGCMRLDLGNAQWVYNTVPNNSAVYIYGK